MDCAWEVMGANCMEDVLRRKASWMDDQIRTVNLIASKLQIAILDLNQYEFSLAEDRRRETTHAHSQGVLSSKGPRVGYVEVNISR